MDHIENILIAYNHITVYLYKKMCERAIAD